MEATLDLDALSKSPIGKIAAGKTIEEFDEILDEVVNLAKIVQGQKRVLDNRISAGEEAVEETDVAMQSGETLELEIDLPIEPTESPMKKTPLAEERESAFDALIAVETGVINALAKEAGVNGFQDSSSTVAGKDPESKNTEKSLAEDLKTDEESDCDAPVENTVSKGTSDKLSECKEQSFEDYFVDQESENNVENVSAPVDQAYIPQGSTDQLADVLSKKIEKTISRVIGKELCFLVERIVAEKLEGILANIR